MSCRVKLYTLGCCDRFQLQGNDTIFFFIKCDGAFAQFTPKEIKTRGDIDKLDYQTDIALIGCTAEVVPIERCFHEE